jgi:hypothetical protein
MYRIQSAHRWSLRSFGVLALPAILSIFSITVRAQAPAADTLAPRAQQQIEQAAAALPETSARTVTGRLTCAALVEGLARCRKNETAWGCTLRCVDTSHYVLQTSEGTYRIKARPGTMDSFAADNVVVTGRMDASGLTVESMARVKRSGRRSSVPAAHAGAPSAPAMVAN